MFKTLRAGSFSCLDFYRCRIKRSFPALFLVLAAVWVAAWLCTDDTCPALTGTGVPIYQDAAHLNPAHVRHGIRFLDEVFLESQPQIRAAQTLQSEAVPPQR